MADPRRTIGSYKQKAKGPPEAADKALQHSARLNLRIHFSLSQHPHSRVTSTSACLAHRLRHLLVGSRMKHQALAASATLKTTTTQASHLVALATHSRNRMDSILRHRSASGRVKTPPAHQARRSALDKIRVKCNRKLMASSLTLHLGSVGSSHSPSRMACRPP